MQNRFREPQYIYDNPYNKTRYVLNNDLEIKKIVQKCREEIKQEIVHLTKTESVLQNLQQEITDKYFAEIKTLQVLVGILFVGWGVTVLRSLRA